MTLRSATFLASMVALCAVATCPAQADVYYVTYTGTASGTDTNGVFGAAGATLSGAAFTATYTYDTALGNSSGSYYNNQLYATQLYGGSADGTTDPVMSETLTINGIAYSAGSSYGGEEKIDDGRPNYFYSVAYLNGSSSNYLQNIDYVIGTPTLSLTATQAFSTEGSVGINVDKFVYNGEQINLTDTYVSVMDGSPTAVPEPSSLALLAGGTAMLGLALGTLRTVSRKHEAVA